MSTSRLSICAFFLAAFGWGIPSAHATLTPAHFSGWSAIPNGTFNSAPAISSWGPGTLIAAGRGMDDQIYTNTWNGSWQASWTPRGGTFISSPSITTWGATGSVIIGLGTNNFIYTDVTEPSGVHHGWASIAGKTFLSDVAVAYVAPRLYVTGRASDGNAYFAVNNVSAGYSSAAWSAWTVIPNGQVYSAPAMFATTANLRVIERGSNVSGNGARFFINEGKMATPANPFDNGTTTTTWGIGGVGSYNSAMSISGWGTAHVDAFGLGTDNFIWAETSENGTWSSQAIQLGGQLMASHPASWSWGTGHINVLARGTNDVFYMNTYQD